MKENISDSFLLLVRVITIGNEMFITSTVRTQGIVFPAQISSIVTLNDPSGATSVPAGLLAGIADLVLVEVVVVEGW